MVPIAVVDAGAEVKVCGEGDDTSWTGEKRRRLQDDIDNGEARNVRLRSVAIDTMGGESSGAAETKTPPAIDSEVVVLGMVQEKDVTGITPFGNVGCLRVRSDEVVSNFPGLACLMQMIVDFGKKVTWEKEQLQRAAGEVRSELTWSGVGRVGRWLGCDFIHDNIAGHFLFVNVLRSSQISFQLPEHFILNERNSSVLTRWSNILSKFHVLHPQFFAHEVRMCGRDFFRDVVLRHGSKQNMADRQSLYQVPFLKDTVCLRHEAP